MLMPKESTCQKSLPMQGRGYICLSGNVKTGHSICKQVTFIWIVKSSLSEPDREKNVFGCPTRSDKTQLVVGSG